MKTMKLFGPALINGAVRYPAEGPIVLTDADAERVVELKLGEEIEEAGEDEGGEEAPLDRLTVPDLMKLAEAEQVPLNGATKKAEIIAAIEKHRAG